MHGIANCEEDRHPVARIAPPLQRIRKKMRRCGSYSGGPRLKYSLPRRMREAQINVRIQLKQERR